MKYLIWLLIISFCIAYIRLHEAKIPPIHGINKVPLSTKIEPDDGLTWLYEQLRASRRSIDIVMYQFSDQTLISYLGTAVKRGVHVRVLLNHGYRGEGSPDNTAAYAALRQLGVAVRWTPSCFDLTHEKSVQIDGRTLDVMTFNFTPQYYASGREITVIDHDTADLVSARSLFESDWLGRCEQTSSPSRLLASPGASVPTLALIRQAQHTVELYNEEMADPAVTRELEAAAHRGVTVRVCMSYTSSWRQPFNDLTTAGVHVRTYTATASRYIHAKMIIVDGREVFVGSQNFSEPSLQANRELGIITSERSVIDRLEQTFSGDFAFAHVYVSH